ncbi:MAG TPA: type IV pili twitching motility protein PilT, partial [Chthonomonadaceae bacterium]|nr:type IV pili twitching motility protein PilT [Chthonomonadaceae bacterium]
MELDALLTQLREHEGSDLHLVVGQPPVFRIDGALVRIEKDALEEAALHSMLVEPLSEEQQTLVTHRNDLEISLQRADGSYRYHVFREHGRLAATIRSVPQYVPTLEQLYPDQENIIETIRTLSQLPRGLVLITGPAGSG